MQQVHVNKSDIAHATLVELDEGELADGWVRLAVGSFSVTANNVTYAVMGDSFGYWNFFPVPEAMDPEKHGVVPMWGHATVIESRHPDIASGERVYGYLPMATHVDVKPGHVSAAGFVDEAAHRQPMSAIYNRYSRLADDPEHDPAHESERMIFGPLFKTGFLIEYFMRSEDWFGARQMVVTSASSKTAMGLASVAKHQSPGIDRIGLTSAGNVEFVRNTGLYDAVYAYDAVADVPREASVNVDFAGNATLLGSIHTHLGDALKHSSLVGVTHHEGREGNAADLPGVTPTLFFAPDHGEKLFAEVGPEQAVKLFAKNWQRFLRDIGGTVEIEHRKRLGAARDAYVEMAGGKIDPSRGIVIQF